VELFSTTKPYSKSRLAKRIKAIVFIHATAIGCKQYRCGNLDRYVWSFLLISGRVFNAERTNSKGLFVKGGNDWFKEAISPESKQLFAMDPTAFFVALLVLATRS